MFQENVLMAHALPWCLHPPTGLSLVLLIPLQRSVQLFYGILRHESVSVVDNVSMLGSFYRCLMMLDNYVDD